MPGINQSARFVDINTLFQIDEQSELVTDLHAIQNSLFNLLNCPVGSRFWNPEYGSALWIYLQEPCDAETAFDCEVSLLQSIILWEPRIALDRANTWVRIRPTMDGLNVKISGTDVITGARFSAQFAALRNGSLTSDITS